MKKCPVCGNTKLIKLYSKNLALCDVCKPLREIPFGLKPNQKSILIKNLVGKND